jgi:threonine aldolase
MRRAMAEAVVGDDVFGDDPTMNLLEQRAAQMLGKEAALFVPSGTMGNQLAIFTHTRRGDEIVCGRPCHIIEHEVGAPAVLSAVTPVTVEAPYGTLAPAAVAAARREPDLHHPRTGLLCLECAHSSGAVPPIAALAAAAQPMREHGIPVHLDGARIFNAAHFLGVAPSVIAAVADSVMFCLSKGLGAPVGSLLCGERAFIERARKGRKLLGGGMRQVGILGGAGCYALQHNIARLGEDHRRARVLARAMAEVAGITVLEAQRDINMVWLELREPKKHLSPAQIVSRLAEKQVVIYPPLGGKWRMVCHLDIDDDALAYAIGHLQEAFRPQ